MVEGSRRPLNKQGEACLRVFASWHCGRADRLRRRRGRATHATPKSLPSTSFASSLAMSSHGGDSHFPKPQPTQSGVKAVLQYTGIPPSWLDKRPSLPSRNWLIFLSVTSAAAGYYIYDRQQCKKIRQGYVDKVKDLAAQPLGSMELPRKVTVYGAKWLGDEDYDRSMKYFRKYVKVRTHIPIV